MDLLGKMVGETVSKDASGDLISKTDANGFTTTHTYNKMNEETSETLSDGEQETLEPYDATGNLLQKVTFDGNAI
jgi:YD repeat-containing protein